MRLAIIFLPLHLSNDTERRIKVYPEGGYQLEKRVEDIGWCVEDEPGWDKEVKAALVELHKLLTKHISV